jgi:hypothetical protein
MRLVANVNAVFTIVNIQGVGLSSVEKPVIMSCEQNDKELHHIRMIKGGYGKESFTNLAILRDIKLRNDMLNKGWTANVGVYGVYDNIHVPPKDVKVMFDTFGLSPEADVKFTYTNHAGITEDRWVHPIGGYFGTHEYYDRRQWLITAWDFNRKAIRTFSPEKIRNWRVAPCIESPNS